MQTSTKDTAKSLADLPESTRKQTLTEQLAKIVQCSVEERTQAVADLLEGICDLPEADCKKVAKSHLQCLCELPDQSRKELMPLHAHALNTAPLNFRQLQITAAKELIPELTPVQRGILQQLLSQISSR